MDHEPDPGRSRERARQHDAAEREARKESLLRQLWRSLTESKGRPAPPDDRGGTPP